ncbi:MAG: CRTAC1 family protein, partial [Acidobacteriota bacterium]|nr:CRTAC1 family protein [Acidobacteriota bacterium]
LGDATFEDRTPATGLGPASMPHTGFGTALFDADHDGDLDLALVNGRVRRGASLSDREERQHTVPKDSSLPPIFDEYAETNLFFINEGGGSFRDASVEAGWSDEPAAVSRGLLVGDFDQDGDPDLLVTNCGSRARLFRNDLPDKGHWLAVEVLDGELGRAALGASIQVEAGTTRLLRTATSTYGYLAAGRPRAHFGLSTSNRVDRLLVRWPNGSRVAFSNLPVDHTVRIIYPGGFESGRG